MITLEEFFFGKLEINYYGFCWDCCDFERFKKRTAQIVKDCGFDSNKSSIEILDSYCENISQLQQFDMKDDKELKDIFDRNKNRFEE